MNLDPNHLKHRAHDLLDSASDVFEDLSDKGRPYVKKAYDKAKPVAQDVIRSAKVAARKARPVANKIREAAGETAKNVRPYAEKAVEGVTGGLNRLFDLIEEKTSTDLDGDGVVGEAVRDAIEVEVVTEYDVYDSAAEAKAEDEAVEPEVVEGEPAGAEPVEAEVAEVVEAEVAEPEAAAEDAE